MSQISDINKKKFSKKNAFSYFDGNIENSKRIEIIKELIKEYIKDNPNKKIRILDLGCGDGNISNIFVDLGLEVYGVDVVKTNSKELTKKGIKFFRSNVENKLPFDNNYFDYIFIGELIEHIFDTKKLLNEINRILKFKGKLLITTPNLAHITERYRLLIGLNPANVSPIHEFLYLHIRPFTLNMLNYALILSGFKVEKIRSTMVVFIWRGDKVVLSSRLLAKIKPTFGQTLIVESTKIK